MDFVAMKCSLMSFLETFIDRVKQINYVALILIIRSVSSFILSILCALVGTLLGAFNGVFLGQDRVNGFIQRAAIGALAGANFSLEVYDYCLELFGSGENVMGCLSYLSESISTTMLRDFERRMYDNAMRFDHEVDNIFDIGGPNGLSVDSVANIPKITVTSDNNVDRCGERVSCTVCLQGFQVGETVRRLPHCHHMFHIPCIDMWLIRHGSCPLCRRAL